MNSIATPSAITSLVPTAQPITVSIINQQPNATDYAAWAGFILSLLLGAFEFWKYWNDKAKLKITYRFNQEIMKMNEYGQLINEPSGKVFWTVDVANVGSKNIIITSIAFARTDTKKMSILTKDLSGIIRRYTIAPGDNHSYTISNELLDPTKVKEAQIFDATGIVYKKVIKYKE